MKTISELIKDKQKGIDCTEAESAELKMFVKEEKEKAFPMYNSLVDIISKVFPLEYGEAMEELENNTNP